MIMGTLGTNYYDENCNYLFVRQGEDGMLYEHIFIHLDDDEAKSFLALFESYNSDVPLNMYRLEKFPLSKENFKGILSSLAGDYKEKQIWKRIKVTSVLPSTWRMIFDLINEKLKTSKK